MKATPWLGYSAIVPNMFLLRRCCVQLHLLTRVPRYASTSPDLASQNQVRVDMSGLVYVEASHALACSKLSVDGDVALAQRAPLRHDGSAVTLMESALQLEAPGAGTDAPLEERTSFASLLAAYKTRNETTVLDNAASVWEGGSGASGCTLSLRLRVPPAQRVAYIPGALETVKHAWVQFIAVYVIFWWLLRKLEWVVFHYRILPTRTVDAAGMKKTL